MIDYLLVRPKGLRLPRNDVQALCSPSLWAVLLNELLRFFLSSGSDGFDRVHHILSGI